MSQKFSRCCLLTLVNKWVMIIFTHLVNVSRVPISTTLGCFTQWKIFSFLLITFNCKLKKRETEKNFNNWGSNEKKLRKTKTNWEKTRKNRENREQTEKNKKKNRKTDWERTKKKLRKNWDKLWENWEKTYKNAEKKLREN